MSELSGLTIWTIGHSTLEWDRFLELLRAHGIACLADVRRFPGSRRYPQFRGETMNEALPQAGIRYLHFPDLGGRRKPLKDSPNTAWRNDAFRAYADHLATEEYGRARNQLIETARQWRTVMVCSEAVWWRCHRSLIADDFKSAGATVLHIFNTGRCDEHPYTGAARLLDGKLCYGPEGEAARPEMPARTRRKPVPDLPYQD